MLCSWCSILVSGRQTEQIRMGKELTWSVCTQIPDLTPTFFVSLYWPEPFWPQANPWVISPNNVCIQMFSRKILHTKSWTEDYYHVLLWFHSLKKKRKKKKLSQLKDGKQLFHSLIPLYKDSEKAPGFKVSLWSGKIGFCLPLVNLLKSLIANFLSSHDMCGLLLNKIFLQKGKKCFSHSSDRRKKLLP